MTIAHTHKANFGRKVDGCPRCAELTAGAKPVQRWTRNDAHRDGYPTVAEIRAHFAPGSPHSQGACGPVCTFGDW
jgi:hypothetical protein